MKSELYLKVRMGMHLQPSGLLAERIKQIYEKDSEIFSDDNDNHKRLDLEIYCDDKPCWNDDSERLHKLGIEINYGSINFIGAPKGSIFHLIFKGERSREALNELLEKGVERHYLQPLFPY